MTKKNLNIILVILFLLSIFARFYQFGSNPISLYWDEVAIGLDARSLLHTGKDINGQSWFQPLFISYGDYKAPVYIWLVTLLGKFLSVNQLSIRLPSLLASLATAFLIYKLIQLVSPKKSSLPALASLSFLIMPWSIHFARIGMESHLSLFFLTLSIYLLISSALTKKPWQLILSSIFISLGIFTYISLRVIAPALFLLTWLIYYRSSIKKNLLPFIVSLAIIVTSIFTLTNSPNYQASQDYRLSNDNLVTSTSYIDKSVAAKGESNTLFSRIFHHRYLYQVLEYAENYFTHFSPKFLSLTGDSNLRHHSGFNGQLLTVQTIFLVIGLYVLFKSKFSPHHLIIITWLLLSPTVAALVNEVPHASRAIYLIIPLSWLIGMGLNQIFLKNKTILTSLAFLALIINLSLYLHDYFSHYPARSAQAWLNPYKQAALTLKDKPAGQHVYITSQFYKPELYIAFYQDKDPNNLTDYSFFLPDTCPSNSWCVAPPDWQDNNTKIIKTILNTDKLVVKESL
ncbi:ArnT family glycosyltransferase [Patescibacteria group bacterium]